MGLKKLLSLFIISVLIITLIAGCAAQEFNAIDLVPQDANMIASIQVSKILNDADLKDAYAKAEKGKDQPQTLDEALDNFVKEAGIDLGDISEAVIFGDVAAMNVENYLGIIVKGTFDKKRFLDNINRPTVATPTGPQAERDFTLSNYKGYELYVDRKGEFAFTLLSKKMVILGSPKAVKDAIDVSKGDVEKASGAVLDTYHRFGDALIKVAFEVPEETRKLMAKELSPEGGMPIPVSMESFADIDAVGLILNKEAELITIRIDSHFLKIESASNAKDTIGGLILLFKGMSSDQEVKNLLGKIEVAVTESWMTIAFKITLSEIEQLVETYQK